MAKKPAAGKPKAKAAKPAKAAKSAKAAKPARAAKPKKPQRARWLDPKSQAPLIDDYAREMEAFLKATSDGVVNEAEVAAQEQRVVALLKEVEPKLDDETHAAVTRLLCELTVYDILQVMLTLQESRPAARFRG
jgi:hypothetical protein